MQDFVLLPRRSWRKLHAALLQFSSLSRLFPSPVLQPGVNAAFAIMGSDFLRPGFAP